MVVHCRMVSLEIIHTPPTKTESVGCVYTQREWYMHAHISIYMHVTNVSKEKETIDLRAGTWEGGHLGRQDWLEKRGKWRPTSGGVFLPARCLLLQVPQLSSITNWGPSLQMHEHTGDISYSNHSRWVADQGVEFVFSWLLKRAGIFSGLSAFHTLLSVTILSISFCSFFYWALFFSY